MRELYLGIDLGTTNSKAAFLDYRESSEPRPTPLQLKQKVIDKDEPSVPMKYLPSVVLFDPNSHIAFVGAYARRFSVNLPDLSVRAVKRLMGKNWRYEVSGWATLWTPQAISAIILKKIRSEALERLHDTRDDLSSAAISVPTSFGSRQREATIEAASLAGFTREGVVLIDEPSAALIHYIYDRREKGQEIDFTRSNKVLVFDMGGGTLDVSIAQIEPTDERLHLQIMSRSRYTELAGTEFDLRLAAYLVQKLKAAGHRIPQNDRDRKEILRAVLFDLAEPLKIAMSSELGQYFNWAYVREGEAFDAADLSRVSCTINPRERELDTTEGPFEIPDLDVSFDHFQQVLQPFFEPKDPDNPKGTDTIYGPIYTALAEAQLSKEDVDIVLMHGQMCGLPLIQTALMKYFPRETRVTTSPDPMTSVAQGAALYHARERQGSWIEIEEPALFESIFYEHKEGFQLLVGKDCRVGQSGVHDLTIDRGTHRVRLPLYQGFNERDSLLAHNRDMLIVLSETAVSDCIVKLRWEIMPNRTVKFEWQDPGRGNGWQPLEELSTTRRDAWYPEEVRRAEADNIRGTKIL